MKGLSNSLTGRFAGWFRKRRQRSKEGKPTESRSIRYLAFILTLVSMMLILTLVPFFPQPLPLLIAVLIAFMTLINPMIGMSVGSVPVALGLLYHISNLNFIAGLGNAEVRVFVIALVMFFFVMLPIRFRRYEDAVAINIGIIAASTLFFDQTYFLAIPLLLTAATVYKRTQIGLSVAYYALISVPLMLEQYYQLVLTIPRSDFWNDPGAVPPFFGSLNGLISQIQVTMPRFRMFDATQSLKTISGQIFATPPVTVHTVVEAINQYIDSFPGIVLFLVIFGGTVWAAGFILSSLSKGSVGKAERLFPIIAASGITALFFLLASVLHKALAFSISIDSTMMATGVLAAALFGVPVAVANYAPRRKVEIEKRSMIVMEKAQSQLTKLKVVEDLLEKAKSTLPINVRSVDGKKTVTKDKLEEILTKTSARLYKLPELDKKIAELDGELSDSLGSLSSELDELLARYQLASNYQYSALVRNLRELGYEAKNPITLGFQKDQPTEERIETIRQVLDAGRLLGAEVDQLSEGIYSVLASLYDPSLPAESGTLTFAKQKLEEKTAPWIATDALIVALNSWNRNYSSEISKSIEALKKSLVYLAKLSAQSKTLSVVLGDKYPKIMDHLKKAAEIRTSIGKQPINLLNVTIARDAFQSSFAITKEVLSIIYEELKNKEQSIESLQPITDYFWEKNITLGEQMASEIEIISNSSKYTLNKAMESLPVAQSLIDQGVATVAVYNEKNELLLNYPVARTVIEDLIRQKKHISIEDLPFEPKDAEKYLRLFQYQRYREFSFDEKDLQLTRKV